MATATLASVHRKDPVTNPAAVFDIVFVHGLGGDPILTWTHPDNGAFWPQWLAERYPAVNVYTAGYDSGIFTSLLKGDGATLNDRATTLLDLLSTRDTAGRPVLFITHSLGGLLVKQVLRHSDGVIPTRYRAVSKDVAGVLFIATPHIGSDLAKTLCGVMAAVTSNSLKQLTHGHDTLIELANWFGNWAGQRQLCVGSYYETLKTKGVQVVDKASANPNVLGCSPVAIDADHISITKLADASAQLFKSICVTIDELIASLPPPDEDGSDDELMVFCETAAEDRRDLATKLTAVNRTAEIPFAEKNKERFSMALNRHIAHSSAALRYTRLLSNINSRFHRHVRPLIESDAPPSVIDDCVQERVLDPSLEGFNNENGQGTAGLADGAYYYLAGNCHIGWDK